MSEAALVNHTGDEFVFCGNCCQPLVVDSSGKVARNACPSCSKPLALYPDRPYYLPKWAEWLMVLVVSLAALATTVISPLNPWHRTFSMAAGMALAMGALIARYLVQTRTKSIDALWWAITAGMEILGVLIMV